jgi:hypothetical protein
MIARKGKVIAHRTYQGTCGLTAKRGAELLNLRFMPRIIFSG